MNIERDINMIAEQPEPEDQPEFEVEYLVSGTEDIPEGYSEDVYEPDSASDSEIPDPGIYIITITLDHERFEPRVDFGGTPMYMVKSLLTDVLETLNMLSPPVAVSSNGEEIFSPYVDVDYDEDDD